MQLLRMNDGMKSEVDLQINFSAAHRSRVIGLPNHFPYDSGCNPIGPITLDLCAAMSSCEEKSAATQGLKNLALQWGFVSLQFLHRMILVLVIGGREHIITQLAIYTPLIPGIYCQLGDYMLPTTFYKNLENPLIPTLVVKQYIRSIYR